MIKFTMGSSDGKKTARRKPKRAMKTSYLQPNTNGSTSVETAACCAANSVVNGCLQNAMPTCKNTLMQKPGDQLTSPSQLQETQTLQKFTSGRENETESVSSLPFSNFYLSGVTCIACRRPRIDVCELNLGQFDSGGSVVVGEVSAFPQLWVCHECQQSIDHQRENDPMASYLLQHEELMLDPPSSPIATEVSDAATMNADSCNCSSCTERRQIKEQHEKFEHELQQYTYDLQQLISCIYRSSTPKTTTATVTAVSCDTDNGYHLSTIDADKMLDLVQRFCSRDPHRLFQCLECRVQEFLVEQSMGLVVHLPSDGQPLTVLKASQLITALLDEYSNICTICRNLTSFFGLVESQLMKSFSLTLELHHKYLFYRMIYAELQKFLPNAIAQISLHLTKVSKENAEEGKTYSQLIERFMKLEADIKLVITDWQEYCQVTDNCKEDQMTAQMKQKMMQDEWEYFRQWARLKKQTNSKSSKTKTMLLETDSMENHLMERAWSTAESAANDTGADLQFAEYEDPSCPCNRCNIAHMIICGGMINSDISEQVTFPGQLLFTGEHPVSFIKTSPSVSSSSSCSSGSASPNDNADSSRILVPFDSGFQIQLGTKEEEEELEEEVDEDDDEVAHESEKFSVKDADLNKTSPNHPSVTMHSQNTRKSRKTEDDSSGDDDDDDEEDDDGDDELEDEDEKEEVESKPKDSIIRIMSTMGIFSETDNPVGELVIPGDTPMTVAATGFAVPSDAAVAVVVASDSLSKLGQYPNMQGNVEPERQLLSCQCHSCVPQSTKSISASLPRQQPPVPTLSTLSIYPHIHGPSNIDVQATQMQNSDSRGVHPLSQPQVFALHHQQGDGIEQQTPKDDTPEMNRIFPDQVTLTNWERQSIFVKHSEYNKLSILTAANCPSLFMTVPPTSDQSDTQMNLDSKTWFKVNRPTVVNHSCMSPQKGVAGVVMSSPGIFDMTSEQQLGLRLNSGDLRYPVPHAASNEVQAVFPLAMPNAIPVAKYAVDQPYFFHAPLGSLSEVSNDSAIFCSSAAFINQSAATVAAPALFLPVHSFCHGNSVAGACTLPSYDLLSQKLRDELIPGACINGALLTGTVINGTLTSGFSCGATTVNGTELNGSTVVTGIASNASVSDVPVNGTTLNCTRAGSCNALSLATAANLLATSTVIDATSKLHPDQSVSVVSMANTSTVPLTLSNVAQFSLGSNHAVSFPSVNFSHSDADHPLTLATESGLRLACHQGGLPCQSLPHSLLPPTMNNEEPSSPSGKTDSQLEDCYDSNEDESGTDESSSISTSNQKEGKYCECWHCEVFGHSNPVTLPTSKNYPEMRDRLRLRLKKKQNELKTVEPEKVDEREPEEVPPVVDRTPCTLDSQHQFDIDELLKFINGENNMSAKPSARAAKRARQKLRKLQEKQKQKASELKVVDNPKTPDTKSHRNCNEKEALKKNMITVEECQQFSNVCLNNHPSSLLDCSKSCLQKKKGSKINKKANGRTSDVNLRNVLNLFKPSSLNQDLPQFDSEMITLNGDGGKTKQSKPSSCKTEDKKALADNHDAMMTIAASLPRPNGMLSTLSCSSSEMHASCSLKQSSSCCMQLNEKETHHAKKTTKTQARQVKNEKINSEKQKDACDREQTMKEVTISSEDGMQTILASPLLQAELAKNKPLQKLFMQAVQQQQQQARERLEAGESVGNRQPSGTVLVGRAQQSTAELSTTLGSKSEQMTNHSVGESKSQLVMNQSTYQSKPNQSVLPGSKSQQAVNQYSKSQPTSNQFASVSKPHPAVNQSAPGSKPQQADCRSAAGSQPYLSVNQPTYSTKPQQTVSKSNKAQQTMNQTSKPQQSVNQSSKFQQKVNQSNKPQKTLNQSSNCNHLQITSGNSNAVPGNRIQREDAQTWTWTWMDEVEQKTGSIKQFLPEWHQPPSLQSTNAQEVETKSSYFMLPENGVRKTSADVSGTKQLPNVANGGQHTSSCIAASASSKPRAIQNEKVDTNLITTSKQVSCEKVPVGSKVMLTSNGCKVETKKTMSNGKKSKKASGADFNQSSTLNNDSCSKCTANHVISRMQHAEALLSDHVKTQVSAVDKICNGVNFSPKHGMEAKCDSQGPETAQKLGFHTTETHTNGDVETLSGVGTNGSSSKSKKNRRKGKGRNSLASVDEIFLPKDVSDDGHLDEFEREIEEFKRFCFNSAPVENREKLQVNVNLKDIFSKKKSSAVVYL